MYHCSANNLLTFRVEMFRAILRGRLSEYFPLKRKFKRIAYDDDLAEVCQPPFKKRKRNPKE